MKKRKFSPSRFYKLAKVVVLAISGISLLLAYLNYEQVRTGSLYFKLREQCEAIYQEPSDLYFDCVINASQASNEISDQFFTFLLIGVGLPIIFFGSVFLYKYLFPSKD